MRKTFRLRLLAGIALLALGAASVVRADHGDNHNNNGTETRLRTRLSGGTNNSRAPEGNAEFRSESAKGRTRLQVEVENVNLPKGTVLDVSVQHPGMAAMVVGHFTLGSSGSGELELNSQDGDVVPALTAGDMVIVSNAGIPVLSGTF